MKTHFTFKNNPIQCFYLVAAFLMLAPVVGEAQTKHVVEATNYVFTPDELEIAVGDTVEWRNNEGIHNVNGTQETFPSNPESFGNDTGEDWVYSYVFTVAGEYDYQCDVHVAQGMVGTVTVSEPTAVFKSEKNSLKIYPNPASRKVWIETANVGLPGTKLDVYDITGKLQNVNWKILNNKIEFNVEGLQAGIYMVNMQLPEQNVILKLIKK